MKQVTIEGSFKIVFEVPDYLDIAEKKTLEEGFKNLLRDEFKKEELIRMLKVRTNVYRADEIDVRDILGVMY